MKLTSQIQIFNKVSFLEKLLFTKHLSVMIKSGIPLADAIDSIADQSPNPEFKKLLQRVVTTISNGQSLASSLAAFPKVFDPFYLNLIDIGEKSGNLEENLLYLAEQLKKDYEFKKKVVAASIYPTVILATAFIVGGGISLFVLPQLIELFKSLDTELPFSTKVLLWISTLMRDYGVVIFAALFMLIVLFRLSLLKPKIKYQWDELLLKLPLTGVFVRNVEMTSFTRNLGIMLRSGLSLTNALEAQMNATSNLVFKEYLKRLLSAVDTGKSIEETLNQKYFRFIPKIGVKMIGVGEKTGKLDETLLYLGDFFEDEVDNTTKNFSSILEPILLLVIGLVVAFIAFAVISPIYEFTGSIKK